MTKVENITRESMIKAIKKAKEQYLLHDLIVFETYLGTMSLSMKGKTSNGTKQVYIEEPSGKFIYTTVDYFLIRYSSLNEQVLNWIRERK